MADNIAITAGSGTTVSTEEVTTLNGAGVSAQHLQRVVPAFRTADGTAVDFQASTAFGDGESNTQTALLVEAYLSAYNGSTWDRVRGSINQGLLVQPAPKQVRISVTPTIDTTAMTSGDSLGGLLTFANAARYSGGSGIIQSITVLDRSQAQRAAMDILFFDRSVTVAANNAAIAMSDSDMAYFLGLVSIGPYNTAFPGTPLNSVSTLLNVGLPFVLNGTDLFAAVVVRATPTYAVGDITITLGILQD